MAIAKVRPADVERGRGDAMIGICEPAEAVLDRFGVIVDVNQAWRDICARTGRDPAHCGPGASYLAVCDRAAGDPDAEAVAEAVRTVLRGGRPAPPRILRACDGAASLRWITVEVSSPADGGPGAVVRVAPATPRVGHRLAEDLHDTVVQDLIAIGMQLSVQARRITDPEALAQHGLVMDQLAETVRRLRALLFDLREPPQETDLGVTAYRLAIEAARVLGHLPVLRLVGPLDDLPPAVAAAAAAVLREALSNVARHAMASRTVVSLSWADGWFTLSVVDDGIGLPATPTEGDGLRNMRRRARASGGRAEVGAALPTGTRVLWRIPVPGAPSDGPRERPSHGPRERPQVGPGEGPHDPR